MPKFDTMNSKNNHSDSRRRRLLPVVGYEVQRKKQKSNSRQKQNVPGVLQLHLLMWTKFKNLKPSTTSISLRLTDSLLEGIRQQANKLDVPYQSLMKVWLTEKLREVDSQGKTT
jgi:predicted DNA binding CopG/RHH family protein